MIEEGQKGELVTVKEAAQKLHVSVRTVWRMVSEKQLTRVQIRRCTRLLASEVLALLGQNHEGGCA